MNLIDAIHHAQTGTQIVYWRGHLPHDKSAKQNDDPKKIIKSKQAGHAAKIAYELYLDGEVHLLQRRLGFDDYEYIAVRADPVLAAKRANLRRLSHGIVRGVHYA